MGEIYEAEDRTLRVRVALKVIRHEIAGDAMAMERFRREMLLARQVTHPNICRLFDVFVHRLDAGDDVVFLTMELLDGRTLAEELDAGGAMSESDALPLVRQLVSALEAAHGVGVVHRDFKTANVMMVGGAVTLRHPDCPHRFRPGTGARPGRRQSARPTQPRFSARPRTWPRSKSWRS